MTPRGHAGASVWATTAEGVPVPLTVAEALLTDPAVRALLLDGHGDPLKLGRTRRLATAAQKQALAVRDGGCIFPGCDMPPSWCDTHHQPAWEHSGLTDIDLMGLLCRHHHVVTHRPHWQVHPHPSEPQRWYWTTPTGRKLYSQRRTDHTTPLSGRPPQPG